MKRMVCTVAVLYLTSFAIMSNMVVIPAADGLFADFPDASPFLSNFVLSGPALFTVFFSILCSVLMHYWSKRRILIVSTLVFCLAASCGAMVESIYYIAAMRAVVGMTIGLMNTAAISLLTEIAASDKQRGLLIGGFNAAISGMGMALSAVAGYVAAINWRLVFYIYLFAVPVLLMLVIFVPETPLDIKTVRHGKDSFPLRPLILLALFDMVMEMAYCMLHFQRGLYIAETGIGGAELAGVMGSVGAVGNFIASLLLPFLYIRIKRGTPVVFFTLLAISHLILCLPGIPESEITIGVFFLGAGFAHGLGLSYYFVQVPHIVPASKVSFSIGIITAANGIGMFLSTYFLTFLQWILGTDRIAPTIPFVTGVLFCASALSLFFTFKSIRKGRFCL